VVLRRGRAVCAADGRVEGGLGAGFGALVVPMLSLTVPVPQVAAIMLPLLAVMASAAADADRVHRHQRGVLRRDQRVEMGAVRVAGFDRFTQPAHVIGACAVGADRVWAGAKITRRVKPTLFYALVHAGMLAAGVKLMWDGLR
jgi:uncharacterized membrane protein YfcA